MSLASNLRKSVYTDGLKRVTFYFTYTPYKRTYI